METRIGKMEPEGLDLASTRRAVGAARGRGGGPAAYEALQGAIAALADVDGAMVTGTLAREAVAAALEDLYELRDGMDVRRPRRPPKKAGTVKRMPWDIGRGRRGSGQESQNGQTR